MADNKFFTNTYITGSGRQNYLRIDNLEDPLFTSFTFDIDFNTSPLFYTINNSYFDTANAKEYLSDKIEAALKGMRAKYMGKDQGYDILPVFSCSMIDDDKLGFGLQQNVYMDLPLYGATEYIYMVDKRNANGIQNDVRYNSSNNQQIYNESTGEYEYSKDNNNDSYKLGDSVKGIVNESDKRWAKEKIEQNKKVIEASNEIIGPGYDSDGNPIETDAFKDHKILETKMKVELFKCKKVKCQKIVTINGKKGQYPEAELLAEYNRLEKEIDKYEVFKQDIVKWVNEEISIYQSSLVSEYNKNKPLQDAITYGLETKSSKNNQDAENKAKELTKLHGDKFRDKLREFLRFIEETHKKVISYSKQMKEHAWWWVDSEIETDVILRNNIHGDQRFTINLECVLKKFGKRLEELDIDKNLVGNIKVGRGKAYPDWVESLNSIGWFIGGFNSNDHKGWGEDSRKTGVYYYTMHEILKELMSLECNIDTAFNDFDEVEGGGISNKYRNLKVQKDEINNALYDVRFQLYGTMDGTPENGGNNYSIHNPDPDSAYGKYKAAEEAYQNDEYSQAEKAMKIANSENESLQAQLEEYAKIPSKKNKNEDKSVQTDIEQIEENKKTIIAPQTVIDIVGFISGMKKMIQKYPYIIQGITGLDTAYNKHYGIKDPYLGSGEDKITLTCLESIDLRVSSMFNRYFNAVYDRQYRRERVPVNLRRFNCSVYVHDVRNFASISSSIKNRITELSDMYYGVIEFKFYDCEIVPEETGNIFNDISNEAPSEMKKTNFTFTYGNCVVNFVPKDRINYNRLSELAELDKIASLELDVSKAGFQVENDNRINRYLSDLPDSPSPLGTLQNIWQGFQENFQKDPIDDIIK